MLTVNIFIAVTELFFGASSPGCMDGGAFGVPYFPRWRTPHHLPSSRAAAVAAVPLRTAVFARVVLTLPSAAFIPILTCGLADRVI